MTTCAQCGNGPLPRGRTVFCCTECSRAWHNAQRQPGDYRSASRPLSRGAVVVRVRLRRCGAAILGERIPPQRLPYDTPAADNDWRRDCARDIAMDRELEEAT